VEVITKQQNNTTKQQNNTVNSQQSNTNTYQRIFWRVYLRS